MVTIETIKKEMREHGATEKELDDIRKAYQVAEEIHKNQFRQSGEPYITHPLHVADHLLKSEVYDSDTICAALLHDTIEDAETDFTKESVAKIINPTTAELVDGVTKMRRLNFTTKDDQKNANTRKIIKGLEKDIRIILIKLADRAHNMETLQYKSREKQQENARETQDLFVRLAFSIGAYRIKNHLEDLSLKYLEPEVFNKISNKKDILYEQEKDYFNNLSYELQSKLIEKGISNDIIFRSQTISTLNKKIKEGYDEIENIYDLFYLKIIVPDIDDCYQTLGCVHNYLRPIQNRDKDYIGAPKVNFYRSLHTTVSDGKGKIVKVKIRTPEMDKVAAYGIPSYWNLENGMTIAETQEIIRKKSQFVQKLIELDEFYEDNDEQFIIGLDQELLTEHVYVYNGNGETIALPASSKALEFVCQVYPELLDKVTGILINGKKAAFNSPLHNSDIVQILTTGKINRKNWEKYATTTTSKQKIKTLKEQINGQN